MINYLDPHSTYLDAKNFHQLQIETTGKFGGLGIVVAPDNGFIKVISPIDDTPAQHAGIKAGDTIIRINGESVQGMPLERAVRMLRGKLGTRVILDIMRPGIAKPLRFKITRETIHIKSVKSRLLAPGFGYVRISSFQSVTPADLALALHQLREKNKVSLRGLILDLRNDPGGLLISAVSVANTFLNKGLIVYTKGRMPGSDVRYIARSGDVLHGVPMVVLVNGGTASAAEIVAGALQDNHRALVVGTRTFGKGSVQTVLPLSRNTAIKLTTALYYTPNGQSIQAKGIIPNIVIEPLRVQSPKKSGIGFLREAGLSGHLNNPEGSPKIPNLRNHSNIFLAHRDFQLYEALTLLKGLNYRNVSTSYGQLFFR